MMDRFLPTQAITWMLMGQLLMIDINSCVDSVTPKIRKKWVLIVAGAKDYKNYFSQSLACRAYHTARKGGIPGENIVLMSYDDVAMHPLNPYPGQLITVKGGPDVYKGCNVDYREADVSSQVFLKVLAGDRGGVFKLTGRPGKVVDSSADDNIFIYMIDHGAPGGIFYFPYMTPFSSRDLIGAIVDMRSNGKFNKMVVYVEACYAGAMFEDLPGDLKGVYVMTFSNASEKSFQCCYDDVRRVYLGSYSGNGWMDQADTDDRRTVTLMDQLQMERRVCDNVNRRRASHPQDFGDLEMRSDSLAEFLGDG